MWSLDGTRDQRRRPDPDARPRGRPTERSRRSPETRVRARGERRRAPGARRGAPTDDDTLYRIDGRPLKLQDAVIGRESDGWMVGSSDDPVARASYTRYDVSDDEPGLRRGASSRGSAGARSPGCAARARQPSGSARSGSGRTSSRAIERVTETRTFDVPDCKANGVRPQPAERSVARWRSRVAPTFSRTRSTRRTATAGSSARVIERAGFQPLVRRLS